MADAQLVDISQVLTWPQALVAVVIILAGVVWPTIATWLNSHRTQRDLQEVKAKAEVAAHEVRPNSGKSLADAVNRIEATQVEQGQLIGQVVTRLERLERPRWSIFRR